MHLVLSFDECSDHLSGGWQILLQFSTSKSHLQVAVTWEGLTDFIELLTKDFLIEGNTRVNVVEVSVSLILQVFCDLTHHFLSLVTQRIQSFRYVCFVVGQLQILKHSHHQYVHVRFLDTLEILP